MLPRVGGRNLVSRLKKVVLPAPLGPISAWMSPALDLEVHVVDGHESLELLGQPSCFENELHWQIALRQVGVEITGREGRRGRYAAAGKGP
jgi:hypothetical protein